MKRDEYKQKLWKEYVENNTVIDNVRKEGCMELGEKFLTGNVSFLYELYNAYMEQERFRVEERLELEYEKSGEDYYLRYQGEELVFEEKEFKDFLETMISIFEDILPLGSVVELKKEFMGEEFSQKEIGNVRAVIVQRYVGESPEGFYYPYAATLYPTGIPGSAKLLQFTPALIEKVISRGYSDEQEEAYVYLMKRELLLERKLHSMAFATKEDVKNYEAFLKGGKSV